MIATWRRRSTVYGALVGIVIKERLAFTLWFWSGLILRTIAMAVFVFFWRGVYAGTDELSGLTLQTTLNYILMAQIFEALTDSILLWEIGYSLREGGITHILLRPLDMQLSYYIIALANMGAQLVENLPMVVVAMAFFGLTWPTDPAIWGAFIVTAFLGRTVMFLFDWLLASLTFYTTEVWGLSVLVFGMGLFFSGAFVPLALMPDWLRAVVLGLPFAQTLAIPMQILSGITPVSEAPGLWLTQLAWIAGLFVVGRVAFSTALKRVTVQGG